MTQRVARTTQQTQTAVRASVSIPGLADPAARAPSLTTPPPSPPRPAGTPLGDAMMMGRRLDYEAPADATVAALEDDNELKETVEETVEEKLAALAAKNSALEAKFAALEAKLMHMAA